MPARLRGHRLPRPAAATLRALHPPRSRCSNISCSSPRPWRARPPPRPRPMSSCARAALPLRRALSCRRRRLPRPRPRPRRSPSWAGSRTWPLATSWARRSAEGKRPEREREREGKPGARGMNELALFFFPPFSRPPSVSRPTSLNSQQLLRRRVPRHRPPDRRGGRRQGHEQTTAQEHARAHAEEARARGGPAGPRAALLGRREAARRL